MASLVIHTPQREVETKGAKSFDEVFSDGIGVGYAFYPDYLNELAPGCTVILLCKDKNKRRAEGRLVKLVATNRWTSNGLQRYDVHFEDRKKVAYKSEKLNYCGIALI